MSFISISFAIFFVIFAVLYHFVAEFKYKAIVFQQILLLSGSFVFYSFANLRFLPFLLYEIIVSYFGAIFCKNKIAFFSFVILLFAPLLFFKYSGTNLIFPLGLSFFTFQSVGYVADCYTKKISAEKNLLLVASFVSFFPVISSGPIQRAQNFFPQIKSLHRFDYESATDGMKLFAWGLFKKLCIADRIAPYVNFVYENAENQYGIALLLATVLYSFQIYCDFSGYSDMAVGASRYLGFDAGKNFDKPYLSTSVGEFWRKWHISLSSWLRDYVYIPLGGSRVCVPRVYLNLMITFLASGLWHGSGWHFVFWGFLHGGYLCAERFLKNRLKTNFSAGFKIVFTFCLVSFAWIFFRADDCLLALKIVKKIVFIPREILQFWDLKNLLGTKEAVRTLFALLHEVCGGFFGMLKILFLLFLLNFFEILMKNKNGISFIKQKTLIFRWSSYYALIFLIIYFMQTSMYSNFVYSQF